MIEKIIHQIWLGPDPAPTKLLNSWRTLHPGWQYHLWTDNFLPPMPNLKNHYQFIKNQAVKADFVRLEALFTYGGLYADADMLCLRPFDTLISSLSTPIMLIKDPHWKKLLNNGLIIAEKKHPFIAQLIYNALHTKPISTNFQLTYGPRLFSRTYPGWEKYITVYGSEMFMKQTLESAPKDAYSIHLLNSNPKNEAYIKSLKDKL